MFKRKLLQHLVIDSTGAYTELCELGKLCVTDKSPYVEHPDAHRHPYTAIYSMLFGPLKNKEIRFAEIGVASGSSVVMWWNYFTKGQIYAFDRDKNFLKNVESMNFPERKPTLGLIDVRVDGDTTRAFSTVKYQSIDPHGTVGVNTSNDTWPSELVLNSDPLGSQSLVLSGDISNSHLFDVILDDSSHDYVDQIRIVKEAWPFVKSGGYMIVEDVYRRIAEGDFERDLDDILKECANAYFVVCNHEERYSPGWNNDKILVLVKS